jgi:acetate kinase
MRSRICAFLEWLGVSLDPEKNVPDLLEADVSMTGSAVRILVIPTDEERLIARDTLSILGG